MDENIRHDNDVTQDTDATDDTTPQPNDSGTPDSSPTVRDNTVPDACETAQLTPIEAVTDDACDGTPAVNPRQATCVLCGQPFIRKKSWQKFHSDACREQYHLGARRLSLIWLEVVEELRQLGHDAAAEILRKRLSGEAG
ncbi:MAG: hypothetical protein ACYS8W_05940 [Planctomycetota bacterium]|jgi:hypothetical protein